MSWLTLKNTAAPVAPTYSYAAGSALKDSFKDPTYNYAGNSLREQLLNAMDWQNSSGGAWSGLGSDRMLTEMEQALAARGITNLNQVGMQNKYEYLPIINELDDQGLATGRRFLSIAKDENTPEHRYFLTQGDVANIVQRDNGEGGTYDALQALTGQNLYSGNPAKFTDALSGGTVFGHSYAGDGGTHFMFEPQADGSVKLRTYGTSSADFGKEDLMGVAAVLGIAAGGAALAGSGAGAEAAGTASGFAGDATAAGYGGLDAASASSLGGGYSVAGGAPLTGIGSAGTAAGAGFVGDATAAGYGGLDAAGASSLGGGSSVGGGSSLTGAATAGAGGSGSFWSSLGSSLGGGSGWSSLIGPAASVASGLIGANAAGKAADAQAAAMDKAIALQEPFRQGGIAGMNKLLDLYGLSSNTTAPGYGSAMKDPTFADLQIDPVYQFRQTEGEKAIQRAASSAGRSDSGRAYKDLMRFNQGLASEEGGNAYNRWNTNQNRKVNYLQSLMGSGQTATNQVGGYLGEQGTANASGYVGRANALTGAIGQGWNMYQGNQLMDLMKQRTSSY